MAKVPSTYIIQDTRFDGDPLLILETINPDIWPEEIALVKNHNKLNNLISFYLRFDVLKSQASIYPYAIFGVPHVLVVVGVG